MASDTNIVPIAARVRNAIVGSSDDEEDEAMQVAARVRNAIVSSSDEEDEASGDAEEVAAEQAEAADEVVPDAVGTVQISTITHGSDLIWY